MSIHVLLSLLALTGATSNLLNNTTLEGKALESTEVISEFPYAVFLEIGEGYRPGLCGGSLILVQVILTAATCLLDMKRKHSKVFGYFGHEVPKKATVIRRVVNFKCHDHFHEYNPLEKNNLAVAFLDSPVTLGKFIKKIPLIYFDLNRDTGYAVGWKKDRGIGKGYRMEKTQMRIMSMKECEAEVGHYLRHSVMCSVARHIDKNDAGTGLMYYKSHRGSVSYLAGVLSHIVNGVAVYAIMLKESTWIGRTSYNLYKDYCRYRRHWSSRRGVTFQNSTCTAKYFNETDDIGRSGTTVKNATCVTNNSNITRDGVKIHIQSVAVP